MDFGSVPGCGVHKDNSGLKGAAGVEFITEYTSVVLIGGLVEQGGALSLPGIGGFAGTTEGRRSLFSVFFWSDAAFLSVLALASAFFCLGFRPAFLFGLAFFILVFAITWGRCPTGLLAGHRFSAPGNCGRTSVPR
jgi:hypothetical protein